MIEDETAEKPEGWLDDEPELVADESAEKPSDWYVYRQSVFTVYFVCFLTWWLYATYLDTLFSIQVQLVTCYDRVSALSV